MGYHLRRAANAMLADLGQRIEPLGLTLTEMSVLQLVAANPQIRQSEIGQVLAIKRANMAPLIAALEARGWIHREAIDGRSQGLRLTPSGETLLVDLKVCITENERWILRDAPKQDPSQLIKTLKAIWTAKA
jgi:DNA-binding MarR family transcriptional regulator